MAKTKKKKKSTVKTKKRKTFDSFSEKSLKKYIAVLKKIRKKKVGKKKKKIGITNMSSVLNLLYNADRERKRKKTRNLMRLHPYGYPTLIKDGDVGRIWKSTRVRSSGRKAAMLDSMNQVLSELIGFQLLKPTLPAKKLPLHQRGEINVVSARQPEPVSVPVPKQLPSKPSRTPPPQAARQLPSKPSRAPPIRRYESDSDDSDSDSETPRRRKKKYM